MVIDRIRIAVEESASFQEACALTVELLRRYVPHFHWVGLYLLEGDLLTLAAWDGPEATEHTQIPVGEGICGLAAGTKETVIVENVDADPRYLACFPSTRSEIVVPILRGDQVIGEIDIDSDTPAAFTAEDRRLLEEVARLLAGQAGSLDERRDLQIEQ